MATRADLNISLDGVATPTDPTPENPMGADWERLTSAYAATRTFRERVLGETSGAGTTGLDDAYAAAYFEGVGAEIMGAGMFGLHSFPSVTPAAALERARGAAGGHDVRIGGGTGVVRDFLRAGLVDHLHVSITPIVLGRGARLWDDLRMLDSDFTITTETAESGTIHVTYRR